MLGLMQDWPLLVHKIIDHAALYHGGREVVTRTVEGPIVRTTYRQIGDRAAQLASALKKRGVTLGVRVGTLAWNTNRHLEAWYAISGIGAIYHTLNPRLFPDQIAWIANHAEDKALFFDITFTKLVEQMAPLAPSIKFYVAMTDAAHLPDAKIPNLIAYEDFVREGDEHPFPGPRPWAEFDENTACGLCYTSGTPAIPRACSTRTAPTCCTASWRRCPMRWVSATPTTLCRWCRCFTPTPGHSLSRHR
jgi:fatty-acyl-CoA synthase